MCVPAVITEISAKNLKVSMCPIVHHLSSEDRVTRNVFLADFRPVEKHPADVRSRDTQAVSCKRSMHITSTVGGFFVFFLFLVDNWGWTIGGQVNFKVQDSKFAPYPYCYTPDFLYLDVLRRVLSIRLGLKMASYFKFNLGHFRVSGHVTEDNSVLGVDN